MSQKRPRVVWKQDCVDKTFLDACIHEIASNGWEGGSLKANSWKVVAEKLKTEHNFIVDQKQMKNRYDYLKSKYAAWVKLKNKTGNVYNSATNTFDMTEEEWQAEMKSNKYVEKLRYTPLLYPHLCTQLFDGSTSTGFHSWGPSSTLPHPAKVFNEHDFDNVECTQMETPASTEPPPASEESRGRAKNKKGKQNEKDVPVNILHEDLREVGKEIIKVAKSLVEKNNIDNDLDACMEKLEKLEWEEFDPKYQAALLLFTESVDVRKLWLRLKPSSCEMWVKNAGKKIGFF